MKLNFHRGSNCKKVGFILGLAIEMVFAGSLVDTNGDKNKTTKAK